MVSQKEVQWSQQNIVNSYLPVTIDPIHKQQIFNYLSEVDIVCLI